MGIHLFLRRTLFMASVYAQYGELLYDFVDATCKAFGDNLVGIYLHGSAAMGCFNPASSDIDLIVVIKDALDFDKRRAYIDDMVRLNARAPKKGLEVSVVRREVCDPFVYPTPFEFHFSPMYLDACVNAPDEYARSVGHSDPDLAAHFTVIRERGRVLLGEGIPAVFGEVDGKYYMDSIWTDVSCSESDILSEPVYIVLNLARVLAYTREGLVLSKAEGGKWALDNLPDEFKPTVESALCEYGGGAGINADGDALTAYARYMLGEIRTAAGIA